MINRKGELNKRAVDTGWPYQVALPADACTGARYDLVHDFCRGLSLARAVTTFGVKTWDTTSSASRRRNMLEISREVIRRGEWVEPKNARAKSTTPLALPE